MSSVPAMTTAPARPDDLSLSARPSRGQRLFARPLRLLVVLALFASVATGVATPAASQGGGTSPLDVFPEDFITLQYNDFLGRNPDPGGLAFWSARLRAGENPAALIETMVSTPEFADSVAPVVRLYYAHLQRAPALDGLSFWANNVRNGWTIDGVSEFFARSDEFVARYGSLDDGAYVDLVYRNVLGRAPEAEGRAFWIQELGAGLPRGVLMARFSESPEFVAQTDGLVRATMLYVGMLRRSPEPAGLDFWAGRIDGGQAYASVMQGFLFGPEYANRMATLFPATHPLTGEATEAVRNVPALAVKIDNSAGGKPQTGVLDADIVYEGLVEGNITRLIAVYQSHEPAVVGPVRSVRTTDFDILAPMNSPLLSASGANSTVLATLGTTSIVNVNARQVPGAYFRSSGSAPHNLFARTADLRAAGNAAGGLPPALFPYRSSTDEVVGTPVAGVDLPYGNTTVNYRWNGVGWARTQDGAAVFDASGRQVAPPNVVVIVTPYIQSPADITSPEAQSVGTGQAMVFTDGEYIQATWSRDTADEPIAVLDNNGRPIPLTPGQTWVALPPPGAAQLRITG